MIKAMAVALLATGSVCLMPLTTAEARVCDFTIDFAADAYGDPAHVMTFEVDSTSSFVSPDAKGSGPVNPINLELDGSPYPYSVITLSFYDSPNPGFTAPYPELDAFHGPAIYTYVNNTPGFLLGQFSGYTGHFSGVQATVDMTSQGVPEPGVWLSLLVGMTATGWAFRSTRKDTTLAA